MLYIITTTGAEVSWHVGDSATGVSIASVAIVTADGNELNHILTNIDGIPKAHDLTRMPVMTWFGDHAKFIAYNLGMVR